MPAQLRVGHWHPPSLAAAADGLVRQGLGRRGGARDCRGTLQRILFRCCLWG